MLQIILVIVVASIAAYFIITAKKKKTTELEIKTIETPIEIIQEAPNKKVLNIKKAEVKIKEPKKPAKKKVDADKPKAKRKSSK